MDQLPSDMTNTMKRKRNKPGNPDPEAEVIALSPRSLLSSEKYQCDICEKRFKRPQNMHLHMKTHGIHVQLQQGNNSSKKKKVYTCPESTCVHHQPNRALADLTGVCKHYYRKHHEMKFVCNKCFKQYGIESDLRKHSSRCGSNGYICVHCGVSYSRECDLITHMESHSAAGNSASQLANPPPPENTQLPPPTVPFQQSEPHRHFAISYPAPPQFPLHHQAPPQFLPPTTTTSPPFQPHFPISYQQQWEPQAFQPLAPHHLPQMEPHPSPFTNPTAPQFSGQQLAPLSPLPALPPAFQPPSHLSSAMTGNFPVSYQQWDQFSGGFPPSLTGEQVLWPGEGSSSNNVNMQGPGSADHDQSAAASFWPNGSNF